MTTSLFEVHEGLAGLGPELLHVRDLLEARFLAWAAEAGAERRHYPPLLRVSDLAPLDYFDNFPHLALATCRIDPERLAGDYVGARDLAAIPRDHLTDSRYVLPSAACFSIYLHLRGAELAGPLYVTTVAQCYRNETHYDDLRRLWAFTMREIVCLGSADEVKAHLGAFRERLVEFTAALDLPLTFAHATDPFFQPTSSRAVMQKIFPQKEELIYQGKDGELAIGSLNFHRNFFGERCAIRGADGAHVFTGCVAFGLERWLFALLERYDQDVDRVVEVLEQR